MNGSLHRFAFPGWKYAFFALIVVAIGGYVFFGRGGNAGAMMVVTRGDFRQQVSVSGTVVAAKDADLGFAANGRIAGAYATVRQRVGAGTILAETENGDLVAALAQKRSALIEAQADLAALRAGTRPEEVAVAAAAVENAEAELVDAIQDAYTTSDDAIHNKTDTLFINPRTNPTLTFATSDATLRMTLEFERATIEPMLASWAELVGALSHETVAEAARQSQTYLAKIAALLADANAAINRGVADSTVTAATLSSYGTTLATARGNVNAVASTLTSDSAALISAEKNLALKEAASTSESIAASEAAVAAAEADVENARAALVKTRVFAPFSGIVTRMDAKVGEIVSPSTSLIAMQGDGIFEIETFIPEVAIARLAVGNTATTTLDAYGSGVTFPASVIAVDPAETIKDGVPAYKTTLAFLARDPRIRSGMTADVEIETGTLTDTIVIPLGAVGLRPAGRYVTVVVEGNRENRAVETGTTPAMGTIEIVSGLSAGEVILLAPVAP